MFLLTANSTASFIMLFVDNKRYIRINTGQEAVFYFYFFLVKDKSSNIIFGTVIDTMNAWRKNMFWFAILKGH